MNLSETPLLALELINFPIQQENYFLAYQNPSQTQTQILISQKIEDIDILADMRKAWDNFIDSGQVWALLIGLSIGYMFRGFTSF